ncbi:hypothetical protein ASF27_17460 [Methylobacterium sp. Leaf102]|uniref:hypothetical protein n=1 Tax=Methylobacterium sp. Leaf102 TaxID=1736253 RepID=UPI0006FC19E5|nr:hypothetical protein [Methylobacterium sp. Leaf102]KQP32786.1 hypothetical protein ASF27_17460 [Methylobacterium sp. Leaf102]
MLSRAGLAALLIIVCSRSVAAEDPARSGFAWWHLRPSDVITTGSTGAARPERRNAKPAIAKPGVAEPSGERRSVRVVYPGLTAGR